MRYFLGFLASLGLIVLVFILVLRGFSGDSGTPGTPLADLANSNTQVSMTIDGPVISEQEHQAYRIIVGRSETRIESLQGYQYDTIDSRTYPNNQESFMNFLRALDLAGFTKGDEEAKDQDERGVCADGNRFIFETIRGTSEVQRYWATSCGGQGNFKGDVGDVRRLFNAQVPQRDFRALTGGLRL